jgi:hypothetical protein
VKGTPMNEILPMIAMMFGWFIVVLGWFALTSKRGK